ncbi:ileal sodium/bile acid cotransporter isoform X3 [Folsomia candida]|nr:ileal sodium/bile acid cotransporter isoform X3 [Folsomia candida]XP_021954810.1 ileal sodium/bile acid cotransporter isoform X3 [Folsomia candida]XP_035708853.1 ileal sodium/bile acid cotransporter isoform X3 [Folsomia candida]XP_035708854.1 ileal sodium/bile acid cotransporter isoform X3 [Folsomia candida]
MCPLWPFHIFLLYLAILGPLLFASFGVIGAAAQSMSSCNVSFEPERVNQVKMGDSQVVDFKFNKTEVIEQAKLLGFDPVTEFEFLVSDSYIAYVTPVKVPLDNSVPIGDGSGLDRVSFNVTGNFLGYTEVCATSRISKNASEVFQCMPVSVVRESGVLDKAFTYSVAALVTVIYVNMGAALDMRTIKETIKKPWGPAIGFMSQFIIMPLLSFGIAKLFISLAALQLGLFITGCSPGGGASNIWTLTLGGNLDLSITMTTISTFSAFVMMPLWMLTLGSTIFKDANLTVPYSKIATFAGCLVIPLAIGVGIQYKWPNVAKFLVKILKPFAVFLIVFIIIFAVYTNLYLFQLFTWQILMAGMLLPWLGYILGGGTAWLLKQEWRDVIAIGIETGVQNTGLAIFALRFSLPQPEADLTTALPVAVAMMTPVLPAVLMLYQKYSGVQYTGMKKEEHKDPVQMGGGSDLTVLATSNSANGSSQTPQSKQYGSCGISNDGVDGVEEMTTST